MGFYFHVGKKLQDVLVLSDQSCLRIPVKKGHDEKLVIVAKSLGEDEERHGSVSFQLNQHFGSDTTEAVVGQRYVQWITLFDHPDDDLYDGVLGENDDELPRIQIELFIEDAIHKPNQ